ncbi:MAG: hypothetical protein KBH07_04225 [Flavobacteriales bacterium]|nr:hypothetical protein [Flavobacteriales bacterium]MBP9079373.1 hypothetical protein [Flavobacteriales bacterium]
MRKRTFAILVPLLAHVPVWACEVCEKQQPKVLRGITHGTGPQSAWDMPIIVISAVIVLFTLVFAVKFLVWPKEKAHDHIKRIILQTPLHDHGR